MTRSLASKVGEYVASEPASFDLEGVSFIVGVRFAVRKPLKKEV